MSCCNSIFFNLFNCKVAIKFLAVPYHYFLRSSLFSNDFKRGTFYCTSFQVFMYFSIWKKSNNFILWHFLVPICVFVTLFILSSSNISKCMQIFHTVLTDAWFDHFQFHFSPVDSGSRHGAMVSFVLISTFACFICFSFVC